MNRRLVFVVIILWLAAIMGFWLVIAIDQKIQNKKGQEVSSRSHLVETPYFSVILPANWEFKKLRGIDSYIAVIQGDNVEVVVDYGASPDSLAEYEDGPDYSVEYRLVGNYIPKIVVSKRAGGVVAIHFAQLPDNQKLTMYTYDLTDKQKNVVLSMFYSIQINHPDRRDKKPK